MEQLLRQLDLNQEVKNAFQTETSDTCIFLKRTPLVMLKEEEWEDSLVPKIKLGARASEGIVTRLKEDHPDLLFLEAWCKSLAKRIVQGIKTRMDMMICSALTGKSDEPEKLKGIDVLTITDLVEKKILNESIGPWNDKSSTPIADIKGVNARFNNQYDRITLSSPVLRLITATDEFLGQLSEQDLSDRDSLARALEMHVEIYDATYRTRDESGKNIIVRIMPKECLILSRIKDDNNDQVFDFGTTSITEANDSFPGQNYKGDPQPSPVGYFHTGEDGPEDVIGWGVLVGIPRIHDETCAVLLTLQK